MSKKIVRQLPAEIQRVRDDFDRWRRDKRGGDRIPERLWCAAARAARRYGVHQLSRALGVEYAQLKRRAGAWNASSPGAATAEPEFVELAGAPGKAETGCVIELEKGNGTRMRVCVGNAARVDWVRVKEAFLGA